MVADNFEKCLQITLQWEGGYSNHPDDPGGPTNRGIIQREYDAWRKAHGFSPQSVRWIKESEYRAIYRAEYWDAMGCDSLPSGLDLAVFDAAVNSGVTRAHMWLSTTHDIDAYCDARLAFLQRLGRLWHVFGAGWRRRVVGIKTQAHALAASAPQPPMAELSELHAGMKGDAVRMLQTKLAGLGYPVGGIDGTYGERTFHAVALFQADNDLKGAPGVWLKDYDDTLATAQPLTEPAEDVAPERFGAIRRGIGFTVGLLLLSSIGVPRFFASHGGKIATAMIAGTALFVGRGYWIEEGKRQAPVNEIVKAVQLPAPPAKKVIVKQYVCKPGCVYAPHPRG